jgi:hypothetical protein
MFPTKLWHTESTTNCVVNCLGKTSKSPLLEPTETVPVGQQLALAWLFMPILGYWVQGPDLWNAETAIYEQPLVPPQLTHL